MRIFEQLFRVLSPDECLNCGSEGSLLCQSCTPVKFGYMPERCYRCFKQMAGFKTCPTCRRFSVLKYVYVRSEYCPIARELIHKLKFSFTQSAAKTIAREISKSLPDLNPNTIIVHVPAATSHVRQRGFDQAALIARELSNITGLRHISALARLGQQRQVGANSELRQKQMKNAYRPLSVPTIKGMDILLVDDVLTTGSTLESAGLTLRIAGAATVSAAVFAQAS